jgi:hypothetical protein
MSQVSRYINLLDIDFKEFNIDLLTHREVAEISELEELEVDFISISITNHDDILCLREILCDNTKLKIIASLPDFSCLKNLDDILNNVSAVTLSRTFQIINKKNKLSLVPLIKSVISKCNEAGVPVLSCISLNEEWGHNIHDKHSDMHDIIFNVKDGVDGFFVRFRGGSRNVLSHLVLIKSLHSYFETINTEYLLKIKPYESFCKPNYSWLLKEHLLFNVIKEIDSLSDYVMAYVGKDYSKVKILHKLKCVSKICLISEDDSFIRSCKLFFGLRCIKVTQTLGYFDIERLIRLNYGENINMIIYNDDGKSVKIKVC